MWPQVVACACFLFTLQRWHRKCVEVVTYIFKGPHREYLDTFSNFVCNFSTSVVQIIETAIIGKRLFKI